MPSKNDIRFGELAAQHNYTTPSRLKECLLIQTEREKQGHTTCLEHILYEKEYLTEELIEAIQDKMGRKIFLCPKCQCKLNVAGIDVGVRIRCTNCDARLSVPERLLPERPRRLGAVLEPTALSLDLEPDIQLEAPTVIAEIDDPHGR